MLISKAVAMLICKTVAMLICKIVVNSELPGRQHYE